MIDDQDVLQQLRWAVQALAASAQDQVRLFPSFVCPACELLTDFDNWHRAAESHVSLSFTPEQRNGLNAIRAQIESMPESPCFSAAVIRDRHDWRVLRDAASRCLALFGWDPDLPPEGRSTYVRGS